MFNSEKEKRFLNACKKGNLEIVMKMTSREQIKTLSSDVKGIIQHGFILGCHENRHMPIVQYMRATPHLSTHIRGTCVVKAIQGLCSTGNMQGLELVLKEEAWNSSIKMDMNGNTFLARACENGHLDIVKYLLTSPAIIKKGHQHPRVEYADGSKPQPLIAAIRGGHLDIVKFLLSDGALPNERRPPLHVHDYLAVSTALLAQHLEIALYLMTHPSWTEKHSLHEAQQKCLERVFIETCNHGKLSVAQFLITQSPMTINTGLEEFIKQYPAINQFYTQHKLHHRLHESLPSPGVNKNRHKI